MQGEIEQVYKSIQERNKKILWKHRKDAYSKSPRFEQIDAERASILVSHLTIEQAQQRLSELRKEQESLLCSLLLPPTYLDMRYQCPACKDTGYIGDTLKKPCSCYLKYKQRFMLEGARINSMETFEDFLTDIYSDESQRQRGVRAKKLCEAYANSLPNPNPCSLLILGQSGLGKSYLGNAIAYRSIESGNECIRITAYRFVQDVLDGLNVRENRLDRYAKIPLLVLDDLGIEPIIPNITRESLLSIISERQGARLATVCISNLSYEEIAERYSDRFASRLFDVNTTLIMQLTGNDLRGGLR